MTRKEAITYFKEHNEILVSVAKDENMYDYEKQVIEADYMRRCFEANDIAIKALEQEPVLDKMRAEIEELDRYYDNDYFSTNNCPMYKCNEVLLIIDKYKAEGEDKE